MNRRATTNCLCGGLAAIGGFWGAFFPPLAWGVGLIVGIVGSQPDILRTMKKTDTRATDVLLSLLIGGYIGGLPMSVILGTGLGLRFWSLLLPLIPGLCVFLGVGLAICFRAIRALARKIAQGPNISVGR